MDILGGMLVAEAIKTVAMALLWFLAVLFFYHGAKYLKQARRILALNRYCMKCGRHHANPNAKFCRDCGGSILKVA